MVVGSKNSGKSAFLQGLLGKGLNSKKFSVPPKRVVHSVKLSSTRGEKLLILFEGDDSKISDEKVMSKYDLVCMLYDSSNPSSFKYLEKVEEKLEAPHVGCTLLCSKADLVTPQVFLFLIHNNNNHFREFQQRWKNFVPN